ncbi:hypothetical protein ACM66B_001607 [Microbotryomycetes sp. NB124-2]
MLLSNQEFLSALQRLFESRRETGSVFLTHKRLTYQGTTASTSSSSTSAPQQQDVEMTDKTEDAQRAGQTNTKGDNKAARDWPCLVRATDGKGKKSKTKISTLVESADYDTFTSSFGSLLKQSMTSMRKKRKHLIKKKQQKSIVKSATTAAGDKKQQTSSSTTASGATFKPTLTKVVGPRRGAGVEKRRALQRRRDRELKQQRARRKRELQQQQQQQQAK